MAKNRNSLLILFSVVVLDLVGFGIVIPILPFYAEAYGADAMTLGFLLTSYAAMQFIFSPLWGKLSDRIGRKNVLLITMAGAALGLLLLGLADSLWMLFAGRILSGIFGANISVATAYVTDVTSEENRAKGMGLIGAAFGIGFILGPAIGGLLSPYGYSVPLLFAAGLSALNVIYAYFQLQESHSTQGERPSSPKTLTLLSDPYIRRVCSINFFFTLGVTQLEATFAFFMMDRFDFDARQVAYVMVMMAAIMVAIQGGLIKRLVLRFGERGLLLAGGVFLALGFFWIPFNHRWILLLLPLAICSVGRGIGQPSLLSLASKETEEADRGAIMGLFQSSASLARVLGPVTAGWLYDSRQALPYYLATILMGLVFVLSLGLRREVRTTIEEFSPEADAAAL